MKRTPELQLTVRPRAGGLLIPTFNGEGQGSWPLSYVATVVVSAVGDSADCSITQELVQFLSWLQINQRAVDRAAAQGWVPLSVAYKKNVIDVLGTIECDGEPALTTAYVIGEGISRPALVDLASNYNSNTFTQKYFASDVPTAVRDITQGTLVQQLCPGAQLGLTDRIGAGAIDFAAVTTGATLEQVHVENVTIIPVLGYAAFPCYNVRFPHDTRHTAHIALCSPLGLSTTNRYPSFASSQRHST